MCHAKNIANCNKLCVGTMKPAPWLEGKQLASRCPKAAGPEVRRSHLGTRHHLRATLLPQDTDISFPSNSPRQAYAAKPFMHPSWAWCYLPLCHYARAPCLLLTDWDPCAWNTLLTTIPVVAGITIITSCSPKVARPCAAAEASSSVSGRNLERLRLLRG